MDTIRQCTSNLSNKWSVFVIGCLQMLSFGPLVAIAACTEDIRSTFHMTEKQYGLIATLYLLGGTNIFFFGIILDKYGPVPVSIISLILTVFSHGGLWQLAKLEPFSAQEYLLYLCIFCGGLSLGGTAAVTFVVNMSNFQRCSHGKVTGTLTTWLFIGGALSTHLYQTYFSPNLGDYFLMVAVFTGIVDLLIILFVRHVEDESDYSILEPEESGSRDVNLESLVPLNRADIRDQDQAHNDANIYPWQTLEFYLLLSVCLIVSPEAHVILFMVSTYTESLGFGKYTTGLLTASAIISAVTIFLSGLLSDYVLKSYSRMHLVLIPCIAQTLALCISIFHIDSIYVLIFLMLTNSTLFFTWNVPIISELHERFGDRHYGTIIGICYTLQGLISVALQYFMGWFYDSERRKQGSPDKWCHGKTCFLHGLILTTILNVIALFQTIIYLYKRHHVSALERCR